MRWSDLTTTNSLRSLNGRISCFVFCILSQDQTTKLGVNFVSISCFVVGQKNETKLRTLISSRFCLRSTTTIESDKIQNTKHEIRSVLYFVLCRPLGTTSIVTMAAATKIVEY